MIPAFLSKIVWADYIPFLLDERNGKDGSTILKQTWKFFSRIKTRLPWHSKWRSDHSRGHTRHHGSDHTGDARHRWRCDVR